MTKNPDFRPSRRFLGLLSRRERWGLSFRGWLVLAALLLTAIWVVVVGVHPYLAVTDRVASDYLVMEGWVHPFTAQAAATEFRSGGYKLIFVTGEPVFGSGQYVSDSKTESWVGGDLLRREGIPEELLRRIADRKVDRDRTYGSAMALKAWIEENHLTVRTINVVTEDVHARRTRLLFQEAFGPEVKVGIIASVNPDYDARRWWRYSEGVREILGESIAWLYAAFIFHPDKTPGK